MQIRRIGLAICLMGAAYTASAGYSWSDYATPADRPALQTHGYAWSELRAKAPPAQKPALATRGYAWSELKAKAPPAEKPAAHTDGYAWSE